MSDNKYSYIASQVNTSSVQSQMVSDNCVYNVLESLKKFASDGLDCESTLAELNLGDKVYAIDFLNMAGAIVIRDYDNQFQACIISGKAVWFNASSIHDAFLVKHFRLWANVSYNQEV